MVVFRVAAAASSVDCFVVAADVGVVAVAADDVGVVVDDFGCCFLL